MSQATRKSPLRNPPDVGPRCEAGKRIAGTTGVAELAAGAADRKRPPARCMSGCGEPTPETAVPQRPGRRIPGTGHALPGTVQS